MNAAASHHRSPARVRLRPTMQSDLEFVLSLERDPENLPYITPWERIQHEAAIRFPDFRHFIVEAGDGLDARGFRRAALRVAKKIAFDDLGAHRFWLDIKKRNTRARSLYDSEGFVFEGEL